MAHVMDVDGLDELLAAHVRGLQTAVDAVGEPSEPFDATVLLRLRRALLVVENLRDRLGARGP